MAASRRVQSARSVTTWRASKAASTSALASIAFGFHDQIFDFVMRPMQQLLPKGGTLVYTDPSEAFMLHVQLALIAGLILAIPVVATQLWLFIAPGLYAHEKRMAIPFVLFSTVGFLAGAAFNHYVAFRFIMVFFASFNSVDLRFMPRIEDVFGLYTKMLLGIGITGLGMTFVMHTDIVAVKGDPLKNIACLQEKKNIQLVMKEGRVYADRRAGQSKNVVNVNPGEWKIIDYL